MRFESISAFSLPTGRSGEHRASLGLLHFALTLLTLVVLSGLAAAQNFGPVNVATAATPQTVTYNFNTSGTLSAVNVLTAGAPGLDYTNSGGTCTQGFVYTSTSSCTVTVAFTPSAPGLRSGAVVLFAQGSSAPLAPLYLSGVGQSGAATIDPGTQNTLATLANNGQASGVAVDGAGNIYVVDNANGGVFEYGAQTYTASTVVGSGALVSGAALSGPTAVALDGAGNLYISDPGNTRVVEVPNEQGTLNSGDASVVSISGLGTPAGLAVDGSGNLYVVDSANGDVLQIAPNGGGQTTVLSSLTSPSGIGLDSAANLYVSGNNQVNEYPAGGGAATWTISGYSNPNGVAVDASGTVYVADSGNNRIASVAPPATTPATLISSSTNSQGVALDSSANVYAGAGANVYQDNRAKAAITFPNTNVGSVSAAQTATVSNVGNQTLDFSNVAVSTNFTIAAGGTNCTSTTQLNSAAQCPVPVEFAPTTNYGPLVGTLTLTDNALNNAASTQTVQLSGIAQQVSQSITFPTIPTQTYGGPPVTLNATASSGLAVSYAVTAGSANVSGHTLTITGAGSVTVQASQAGNTEYAAATPVSQTFNVNQASQTITFTANPPSSKAYNGTFTVAASSSSGLTVTFTSAGPCSNNGTATYTITSGSGTCDVIANQAGNSNYFAAPQVTKTTTATKATQTISFSTPPPATAGYESVFTVVATATSGLTVLFNSSGVCTNSGATYTITSPTGICVVIAAQPGNGNYSAATEQTPQLNATKGTPIITWNPAAITYGTPLGNGQLDATATNGTGATVPGSFKYNPATGKILVAGTQALSATFTPSSTTDYNTVTPTASLQVNPDSTITSVTSSDQTVTLKNGTATATIDFNVTTAYKPAGSVTVTASTGENCSGTVSSSTGNGSCKLTFSTAGTRTVNASYAGDANHTGSNSDSQNPQITVTVNQ